MRATAYLATAIIGAALVPMVASGQMPAGVTEPMIADGETLYNSIGLCFACHGPTGRGVPGAGVDLTDEEWLHNDGSFEAILAQVLEGIGPTETKSGIIMLPRGGSQLNDEQIRAIASYVWSLRNRSS